MAAPYGIHWFRRDLRISGNAALNWNLKQYSGRTLGIFFFDSRFLARSDFSFCRFGFFIETLKCLKSDLEACGGSLLVLDQSPLAGFESLLSRLKKSPPSAVSFNRDYEPFARERDSKILQKLEGSGLLVHTERDHLIIEPHELFKDSPGVKKFYQVFTPFYKKWTHILSQEEFKDRVPSSALQKSVSFKLKWADLLGEIGRSEFAQEDALDRFYVKNSNQVKVPLPQAGFQAAIEVTKNFKKRISEYPIARDYPNVNGTSHLSVYLKNGSISTSQVIALLGGANAIDPKFLTEIVWREFYYHILYHYPHVETEPFHSQYRDLKWENNESWFDAWKAGKTGYPIVDAGMRQLNETGWMHNRVRMIVASFLTKDLLIDYRWGEKYFMEKLLDGDLAPNNGGWQWAASTGCDPQPYFRIFNPVLQSKRFDPKGAYIRKWVPELKNASESEIHSPWESGIQYFKPIVQHSIQKDKALAMYKGCRK